MPLKFDKQFLKFLIVGGVNTAFGYSLYALFIFLGFHYSMAVLFATVLGVLFNFQTTGKIVFKNKNNNLLFKFLGVYFFTYLLSNLILFILHKLAINSYLSGALMLLPMALISFLLNKKFVFTE